MLSLPSTQLRKCTTSSGFENYWQFLWLFRKWNDLLEGPRFLSVTLWSKSSAPTAKCTELGAAFFSFIK